MQKRRLQLALIMILTGIGLPSTAQVDTIDDRLLQLEKTATVLPRYVNFDVIKIMVAHGRSSYQGIDHGSGVSFRMQVLLPWALFKQHFPLAYGLTYGSHKIQARQQRFQFTNHELTAIIPDDEVNSTVQRTGFVGPVLLYVLRLRHAHLTVLTGASLEYNVFNSTITRTDNDKEKISTGKSVNRFSTPLHVQISRSKRQLISWGLFASYDVQPRFKGSFDELKQINAGLSIALIL